MELPDGRRCGDGPSGCGSSMPGDGKIRSGRGGPATIHEDMGNFFRWLRTGHGGRVSGGEFRAVGFPGSVIPSPVASGLTEILRTVLLTVTEARLGGMRGMSFRRPRPSRSLVILPLGSQSLLPSAVRKAPRSGGTRGLRSPWHTYALATHIRHNFLILGNF
jgi:hypothetical protein